MAVGVGPAAEGVRVAWEDVPREVRSAVEAICGSPVVRADTQRGGFSPGVAARVTGADGGRHFVKAVEAVANPDSFQAHRREGVVLSELVPLVRAGRLAAPALHGVVDDDGWVALVLQDVDGRQPALPWRPDELAAVVRAVDRLSEVLTPAPIAAPPAAEEYEVPFAGWRTLSDQPARADLLDAWSRAHLDRLARIEATWAVHAQGSSLLHTDLRADNLLLTTDGVVVVDWPWACIGSPLLDVVGLAPSVAMQGGPQPDELLAMTAVGAAADREAVTALACAVAGYFTDVALQPPPPGLPTVRAFQAAQGEVARRWVAERLALGS
jgi:Phosphotransferase enzyme family